jgi:Dyp-type peroxidase family
MRFGYGPLKEARYVLARVRDAAAARSWLGGVPVTDAVKRDEAPATALQIAFTAPGLESLGVPASLMSGFSREFVSGMTEPSRSRRLGDVGVDAPSQWLWGVGERTPHVVAMFFAKPGRLGGFMNDVIASGWSEAFDASLPQLETGDLDGREPFGFADGISQPEIDWDQTHDPLAPQVEYGNVVALGEFVLGYRNEYGKYTDRPLVDADSSTGELLAAEDAPDKRDVGRNGTYLVMRQLRQDVGAFWDYMMQQAGGDVARAETIASAMVGRTREGGPLVPIASRAIPGIEDKPDLIAKNRFDFDGDPLGVRCPFGAHIRRSNPRNADYVGRPGALGRLIAMLGFGRNAYREDLTSSVRFHRVLRRGREYGDDLSPKEARAALPSSEKERGLHFICLNASIARQFEFLQNAWTMNGKFSALSGETDPVIGNREASGRCATNRYFTMPGDGRLRARVFELPQFVTMRGGAYFFLPGLRALRYIARSAGR